MSESPNCMCVSHSDDLKVHVFGEDHFIPLEEKAKLFNNYLSELVSKCPSNDDPISTQFYKNTSEIFEKFWSDDLIPSEYRLDCLKSMVLFYAKFNDVDHHQKYLVSWFSLLNNDYKNGKIESFKVLDDIDDYIAYLIENQSKVSIDLTNLEEMLAEVENKDKDIFVYDLRRKAIIWIRVEEYKYALKISRRILKLLQNSTKSETYSFETEILFFIAHCHFKLGSPSKVVHDLWSKIILERREITEKDKYYKLMTHFEMGMENTTLTENGIGLSLNETPLALHHFAMFHSYFCLRSKETVDDKNVFVMIFSSWLCTTNSIFGDVMERMAQTKSMIDHISNELYKAGLPLQGIFEQYYRNARDRSKSLEMRYQSATAAIFVKSNLMENNVSTENTMVEFNLNLLRAQIAKEMKMLDITIKDYFYLYEYLGKLVMENLEETHKDIVEGNLEEIVWCIINFYTIQNMCEEKHEFLSKLHESPFYGILLKTNPEFLTVFLKDHLEQGNNSTVLELSNHIKTIPSIEEHWKQLFMGLYHFRLGELVKASKVLKRLRPMPNEDGEQGIAMFAMSSINFSRGDFESSLDYLKKCKKGSSKDDPESSLIYAKVIVRIGAIAMMKKSFRLILETFQEIMEPNPDFALILKSYCRFEYGLFFCTENQPVIFLDLTSKKDNWNKLAYHSDKKIKKQFRTFKNTYLINFITQKKFL